MILLIDVNGKEYPEININENSLTLEEIVRLNINYVYADGYELNRCCLILNRSKAFTRFTFVGDEAKTIVLNWR